MMATAESGRGRVAPAKPLNPESRAETRCHRSRHQPRAAAFYHQFVALWSTAVLRRTAVDSSASLVALCLTWRAISTAVL